MLVVLSMIRTEAMAPGGTLSRGAIVYNVTVSVQAGKSMAVVGSSISSRYQVGRGLASMCRA